ncbi:MAG: hypothetical protein U1E23_14055 [Reyranellaceae bacterium]
MKRCSTVVAVVGLALAACAYQPQSKTDLLSEAGFKTLSLNTPAKVAEFKKMAPHVMTQTIFKGHQVWIYPDRDACGCVYIGGPTAYKAFIKNATQQMIDVRANQMYDNDAADPYNPTAEMANIYWGDAWDASDAYGLYLN